MVCEADDHDRWNPLRLFGPTGPQSDSAKDYRKKTTFAIFCSRPLSRRTM